MYCDLIEAFDNPLGRQIEKYKLHKFNYYSPQGEMVDTTNENFEVESDNISSLSEISDLSSIMSDDSIKTNLTSDTLITEIPKNKKIKKKIQLSHEEYLRILVADLKGLEINSADDAYDHLKHCQFCKDELKLRIFRKPVEIVSDPNKIVPKKQDNTDFDKANKYIETQKKLGFAFILGLIVIIILCLLFDFLRN